MCLPGGFNRDGARRKGVRQAEQFDTLVRDGGGTKLIGMACGRLGGSPVSNVELANSAGSPRRMALGAGGGTCSGVGQRRWAAELGSGV